ncbi:putative trafficking protein particle complex subunit 2 [Tanacetum coccineum]
MDFTKLFNGRGYADPLEEEKKKAREIRSAYVMPTFEEAVVGISLDAIATFTQMEGENTLPNSITFGGILTANTLIGAYGKAKIFVDMEPTLVEMLRQRECDESKFQVASAKKLQNDGGGGLNNPANNQTNNLKEEAAHQHQFILHAALDIVQDLAWTTSAMFLKAIDRFNDLVVSVYVTAGHILLLVIF